MTSGRGVFTAGTMRVAFVAPPGPEADAAFAWLSAHAAFDATRFQPDEIDDVPDARVIWVHAASLPDIVPAERLAAYVAGGGGVLLTLRAAGLAGRMGLELAPPNEDVTSHWRGAAESAGELRGGAVPAVRGLATWGSHPLTDGLRGGTVCWAPTEGEPFTRTCYLHGVRPVGGRVVAVERGYQSQNPDRIVCWEYRPGRGRVLCLGAYVYFSAPDTLLRPQLERLLANALRCAGEPGEGGPWWPERGTHAAPSDTLVLPTPLDLDGVLPDAADDPIALETEVSSDEPFDLAGRRVLLAGRERQGIGEVWVHPHRVVAEWDIAVDGEPADAVRFSVTPDVVLRTLETGRRRITERSFVALEQPVALVEYAAARKGRASLAQSAAALELTLAVDLRRMWPYPAGSGGNLRYRVGPDGRVALVAAESGDGMAAIFTSRPADVSLKAVRPGGVPAVECTIRAPLGVPLRVAVVGAASDAELARALRDVTRLGVPGLVRQRRQRAVTLREARVSLRAPDERLVRALEWAKRRLDLFLGDAPGVGRSLMAGYAVSQAGWGEARPGYAWFFGRDACWSALALLAAGEHSLPRQVLRFLGDTQDVTGKVIHEATTSGQHHYDAADTTPLYLLLVARYLSWTGDGDFVRSIWHHVERAVDFCHASAGEDGLPVNTRVGHGWMESGPLSGAHVTLYVASVWHAALHGLARAAVALGDAGRAVEFETGAARAAAAIRARFRDERGGRFALDQHAGGRPTWTQTALHALPLVLGVLAPAECAAWYDAVAGDAFSTPWGVRLLSESDPHYSAAAPFAGAVWPLLTGWVSIAEYRAGRAAAGLRHLQANAALAGARQLGAFDEMLEGGAERGTGVCADQAWSAALVIAPVVEGLFGVEADAPQGRLTIAPALPDGWDSMEGRGIRCGESVLDVRVRRAGRATDIEIRRTAGPPLWLTVAPLLAGDVAAVEIDGQAVQPRRIDCGGGSRSAVSFQSGEEHQLRFEPG